MRRFRRWLKRLLAGTVALVVVAIVAVCVALHTDWGRDKIRARIEAALRDSFSGGATVGKVEGSVFGTLVVRDLTINGTDHTAMVTIGKVTLEVDLQPLLDKQVHVSSLVVEDVAVELHPRPTEPPDLTPTHPSTWSIELPSIEVRRGGVAVTDLGPEPIHVDELNVHAAVALPAGKPIVASAIAGLRWRERGGLPLGVIASEVTVDTLGTAAIVVPKLVAFGGGASVVASDVHLGAVLAATLYGYAPPEAVATFAPGVVVPHPIGVTAALKDGDLALGVSFDRATANVWAHADLDRRALRGAVFARVPELAPYTDGKLRGPGHVMLAGSLAGASTTPTGTGMLFAGAQLEGLPPASTLVAFDVRPTRAQTVAVVVGPGEAQAAIALDLLRDGARLTVAHGRIDARVADLPAASLGQVTATGRVAVTATIAPGGTLMPAVDLTVSGVTTGRDVQSDALRIAAVDGRYRVRVVGTRPIGYVHVEARGLANAGQALGSAIVDASNRGDDSTDELPAAIGAIDVTLHANHPSAVADVAAIVRPPRGAAPLTIELGAHRVQLAGAVPRELVGHGGTITVRPDRIVAANIVTTHRGGRVELGATFSPASQDLSATAAATNVPMALVQPTAKGSASATLAIARRDGAWSGTASVDATGVQFDDKLVIDGDVRVRLVGRRVSLAATTSIAPAATGTFTLGGLHGSAEIALDVDGPRVITDPRGWLLLTRKDLRAGSVTLRSIDGGLVGASGTLDGTILISPFDTHGAIEVRGVRTPGGLVNAEVVLDDVNGEISATAQAKIEGVGLANVDARVAIPTYLFDPAAWKTLRRHAIREVNARIDDIEVDPELFARFDIATPYRGHAHVALHVGEAIKSAQFTLDADHLRGGAIVQPLELHARAAMDETRSTATVDFLGGGAQLLHLEAALPVTFQGWMEGGYPAAKVAALTGSLLIPSTKAVVVLGIFGRTDLVAGTLDGTGTLGGTLAVPTATLAIAAHDLRVPPHVSGKPIPVLQKLAIGATWDGVGGTVEIVGTESDGGRLKLAARARPDRLAEATAMFDIASFDLAPIAAFLPGTLVAMSGKIAAHFDVVGFEPATMHALGKLVMIDGRIPVSPYVGTLRDANLTLVIDKRSGKLTLTGKLGACDAGKAGNACRTVKVLATGDTNGIEATMNLDHVQPITALQPVITGDAIVSLRREVDRWGGTVKIRNANVDIPPQSGTELLAQKAPSDMVFVDEFKPIEIGKIAKGVRPAPMKPWLVAQVDIGSTTINADELRGSVHGDLELSLGDTPQGLSIGMLGLVEAEQGIADVFGHRYQLDHANVTFDGTSDAQLDIRIVHDFPTVTLIADVGGRVSNPILAMSSDPAQYTEGQLLGFFLGGTPGGDPNNQTREAATGVGTSFLSAKLNRTINRILPVKIDVLNCSAATNTTSAACTLGWWFTEKLFIAYKPHLEAKPDENSNEAHVEYYLRHDVYLEGNAGDRSHHGLDLLWRHRW
ncbi:MAG: translocation/assembly module TamB domain-containing protein [Proteobacteria bacterium]|nr:translocation/assembly module TamB domain-containing protein [Pseudomonadota bacterium]